MAHLWTLLSAGLLLMSVAEPLSSPQENDNKLVKHTVFTKSQASGLGRLLTCMLVWQHQTINKSQFVAFSCCRPRWTRVHSEMSVNQHQATHLQPVSFFGFFFVILSFVVFIFSLFCCAVSYISAFPFSSSLFFFALAAPLTTTTSPNSSLAPQCPGNQLMHESSNVCICPSIMVKDGDNCTCPKGFTLEGAAECIGKKWSKLGKCFL